MTNIASDLAKEAKDLAEQLAKTLWQMRAESTEFAIQMPDGMWHFKGSMVPVDGEGE